MSSVSKTFQELITFSRSTNGTYVNSAGYIVNTPVANYLAYSSQFENSWGKTNSFIQTNLVLWSQTFSNGLWTKQTGASVTGVKVVAPDGTLTGDQISWASTVTGQGIFQATGAVVGTGNNTKSIYVRADVAGGTVELADPAGTVGTPAFTLTTSWQRISLTEIQVGGIAGIWLRKTASSPANVYVWGAQLVSGSVPGDYRATTTLALPILYPDYTGALRARKLCESTASGYHTMFQAVTPATYMASFKVKAGERTFAQLAGGSSGNDYVTFNLNTGVITQQGSGVTNAFITPLGNGWYIVGGVMMSSAVAPFITVCQNGTSSWLPSYVGDGSSGIYVADAQLEPGSSAGPYYDTSTTLTYAQRRDYNPATLASLGLLVEESRANLLLFSNNYSVGDWTKSFSTVTAASTLSPDGTLNGWLLTSTSGGARVEQNLISTVAIHTFSGYVKAASSSNITVLLYNVTTSTVIAQADINLITGVVTTAFGVCTASASNSDWWRFSLTNSAGITVGNTLRVYFYAGLSSALSGSSVYIYGAQLEAGAFATSYIPTTTSQLTRAADVANANLFSQWYNSSAWTLYLEYVTKALAPVGGNTRVIELNNGTINTRALFYSTPPASGDGLAFQVRDAGVDQTTPSFAGVNVVGAVLKQAAAAKVNDFAYTVNGASPSVDVTGTLPTFSQFNIASVLSGGAPEVLNGWLRRITFYPQRLTNAQLQSITA